MKLETYKDFYIFKNLKSRIKVSRKKYQKYIDANRLFLIHDSPSLGPIILFFNILTFYFNSVYFEYTLGVSISTVNAC